MEKARIHLPKRLATIIFIVGIFGVLASLFYYFSFTERPSTSIIDVSTYLSESVNISELMTSEFNYRGIADIYADGNDTEPLCRACYQAAVKAGIDFSQVQMSVDESNKTLLVTLPEIIIKTTIVDEQDIVLFPHHANIELSTLLKFCKEDAEREANESVELFDTAYSNLKATLEALIYPILKQQGYTIRWT